MKKLRRDELKHLLEDKYRLYNQPDFIKDDPISIPHAFKVAQDIEISGFFAAILAWGQRKTIISKCKDLLSRMDEAPYDFVVNHNERELKQLLSFKHRTFNETDLLYVVELLKRHYSKHTSLEAAFLLGDGSAKGSLIAFHEYFFSLPHAPQRTRKHISTPARKSACKRLNMYLRWMVRKDDRGVDFGMWGGISMARLICPCDIHVERVARKLGLITRRQTDWQMAEELTKNLLQLDADDPVKYDFALFGLGVVESYAH